MVTENNIKPVGILWNSTTTDQIIQQTYYSLEECMYAYVTELQVLSLVTDIEAAKAGMPVTPGVQRQTA